MNVTTRQPNQETLYSLFGKNRTHQCWDGGVYMSISGRQFGHNKILLKMLTVFLSKSQVHGCVCTMIVTSVEFKDKILRIF